MKRQANPPNRRRNASPSGSLFISPTTATRALLTAVKPRPKCCLTWKDYGTFCLCATADMKPDIKSLSVLVRNCGEWHEVSLFDGSARTTKLLPRLSSDGLEERLARGLSPATEPSIREFLRQSEHVFQQLVMCIKETGSAQAQQVARSSWTVLFVEDLMQHLQVLEQAFGADSIKDLSDDLLKLTLHYKDDADRVHYLGLELSPETFSRECPLCTTDLPEWQPSWRPSPLTSEDCVPSEKRNLDTVNGSSRSTNICGIKENEVCFCGLAGIYADFVRAVRSYQEFWNTLDDLDANAWILEPTIHPPCRALLERRIAVTESSSLAIEVIPTCPRAAPKSMRWIGAETSSYSCKLDQYVATIDQDIGWSSTLSIKENLERGLGMSLPSPPSTATKLVLECGICYSHELPTKTNGASEFPETACDNGPCGRHYHESCLHDWLHSLPSSRKSFDRLLGTCPYCNEPISAAIQRT